MHRNPVACRFQLFLAYLYPPQQPSLGQLWPEYNKQILPQYPSHSSREHSSTFPQEVIGMLLWCYIKAAAKQVQEDSSKSKAIAILQEAKQHSATTLLHATSYNTLQLLQQLCKRLRQRSRLSPTTSYRP